MRTLSRIRALAMGALTCTCLSIQAVPLTAQEVAAACANADGLAHCGRLIEAIQMQRFPNLARREGSVLEVTLYPAGRSSFVDADDAGNTRSYSLWDYLDAPNIAIIYATRRDDASFLLLQRTNGRVIELPAEPKLAPDLQRVVTADVCADGCSNEIALWRITRDGVRKEASWMPRERWTDATARWKSADTIELEYTTSADGPARTIERRIDQRDWKRVGER